MDMAEIVADAMVIEDEEDDTIEDDVDTGVAVPPAAAAE